MRRDCATHQCGTHTCSPEVPGCPTMDTGTGILSTNPCISRKILRISFLVCFTSNCIFVSGRLEKGGDCLSVTDAVNVISVEVNGTTPMSSHVAGSMGMQYYR